ncbi:MAG: DNA-3-methyladenine glycosylase [Halobacteriovoraceae bacterium]|nr:DNA-3-methyladenine glycosylase [Halobacteriovoraceae bacterium]
MPKLLDFQFFQSPDVESLAKRLLGKVVTTKINGKLTKAMITETEAYCGANDKACHAYLNKRTSRTETMFLEGGHAYIYLCYGIHHLLNIVTNTKDCADAVLIRAVMPLSGETHILKRRNAKKIIPSLTSGPGKVSQALGITTALDKTPLFVKKKIWLEDHQLNFSSDEIVCSKRIGIDYAGKDKHRLWRFYLRDNPHVSQK